MRNSGFIFGTTFSMTYASPDGIDLKKEIHQELMQVVDNSLSTFNKRSILSLINTNQPHQTDSAFEVVFNKAIEISKLTNGAFDITVGPLVKAWGFGFDKSDSLPSDEEIAILQQIVGYQSVHLIDHHIIKDHPETQLDCSSIAKGFGVDVASNFLERKGISNYMVEIGGEIRVSGMNPSGEKWRLGIDKPVEDITFEHRAIDTILHISDMAIASSGNYRQFYYKKGKRYSHTIDPISGYPVNHQLLSATVLAKDCMTADALATSCMVMGTEKSLELAQQLDNVEVYLILAGQDGKYKEVYSEGLKKYLNP